MKCLSDNNVGTQLHILKPWCVTLSIKQQRKLPLDNYVIVKKMKTTQAGKPEHINQPSDLLTKPFAERTPQLMPRFPEDEE